MIVAMKRALVISCSAAVFASAPAAHAGLPPVGLLLGDASKATLAAVPKMTFAGTPGTPTTKCSRVSWMAARCVWTVGVTPNGAGRYTKCTGTLSVVRKQLKGYPLTVTRVAGTKVNCSNATPAARPASTTLPLQRTKPR